MRGLVVYRSFLNCHIFSADRNLIALIPLELSGVGYRLQFKNSRWEGGRLLVLLIKDWLFMEVVFLFIAMILPHNIFDRFLLDRGKLNGHFAVNLDAFKDYWIKKAGLLKLFLHAPVHFFLFLDSFLNGFRRFTSLTLTNVTSLIVQIVPNWRR